MSVFNRRRQKRTGGFPLLLGAVLFAMPFGFFWTTPPQTPTAPLDDGEQIYMSRCMSCHQINGQGIPGVFPPLDGTEWVKSDKGRLIRIVLDGLTGETTVQDVVYSGAMPPWKAFLTDEEIAAVLTYVRNAWSNEAPAVTAQEVAAVRKATADRKESWTEAELEEEENQGIPGAPDTMGLPAKADSTQ
jgi:mono/diheme cytochrome c family protein